MGVQLAPGIIKMAVMRNANISSFSIRLAQVNDVPEIAVLSRDLIENGLGWSWTEARVARCLRERSTNVAVAHADGKLHAFAIMRYTDDEAHLLLLAVRPGFQRRGIGSALVGWVEKPARLAGISCIHLEARSSNTAARAFYAKLGYEEVALARGYYAGRESAVRLAKSLRPDA
jgi:[ribosomal protein S18]-alanine N-acetyltransferase